MKKSFAIDIPSMVFALIAVLSPWWAHFILEEGSSSGILLCLFVIIIAICCVVLSPHFYIANAKGITIYYIFF